MNSAETPDCKLVVKPDRSLVETYVSIVALGCASLVFVGLAVRDRFRQTKPALSSIIPHLNASTLLEGRFQFQGSANAPYTLIEFGDYECPPCRNTQAKVKMALMQYAGKIKLDFRQLPLTTIHPHAEAAAIAAESGRLSGKFWILHDRLYAVDLRQPNSITKVLARSGTVLDPKAAKIQLAEDASLEKKLSVNSTPTFFLCRPDGGVLQLNGIDSLGVNIH